MNEKRFREKLSGRVRFPEDVTSKKMIHGGAVRSPYPSGIIEEIFLPELPEECLVLSYKDVPGNKFFQLPQGKMPLLAKDRVTYVGEPILLVGAPTAELLNALIKSIEVKITPEPELPPLSLDSLENIAYERHFFRGEAEKILERDDLVKDEDFFTIESQQPSSRVSPHVSCQREGNKFIIHSVTQWPSMVRKNTAAVLKLRQDQISLKNYPCENSQETRLWSSAITSCHAALLCQASKKTVRFMVNENDNKQLGPNRGKVELYIRGAISTEGDLMGLKVDFVLDVGAYGMLTEEIIDRMILSCTGVYQCRNIDITGKGIVTNLPPTGFFPDFNLTPIYFAIESFCNNLSRNCAFSPFEWKEKNLIRKGNLFLGNSQLGQPTNLKKIMEKLRVNSDFLRKEMSYQLLRDHQEHISINYESYQRGIALSLAFLGNDFLYNHTDLTTMTVQGVLNKKGELLLSLPVPAGVSRLKKQWALKASQVLSLDSPTKVSFLFDQERMNGGPSVAGRNVTHLSRLIELCCEQIQKKRFRDPLPIEVTRRYSRQESRWDKDHLQGIPFYNLSWGGAAVEVEIDQETFELIIKKIWFVLDAGLILDEPSARITVEQGLYQALDSTLGTNWQTSRRLPEYEVDFISTGHTPRGLDGLVQRLFPPALSCAVTQATGQINYTLPLEKGIIREEGKRL